jgi:hypothetical protein
MSTSRKARTRRPAAGQRRSSKRKEAAPRKRRVAPPTHTEARVALPRMVVISLPAGTATVRMQTTDLQIPFHVGIDGETLMVGSFTQQKDKDLPPGTHHLTWFINHIEADWAHALTIRSGSAAPQNLDVKSEANGDPAISSDVVALVAE